MQIGCGCNLLTCDRLCENVFFLGTIVERCGTGIYAAADCSTAIAGISKERESTEQYFIQIGGIIFSFDGTLQCGQTRCPDPLPSMGWISNIAAPQRSASFARLSWGPDPSLMEGQRYSVVWREFNTQDNFTVTSGPEVRKIEIFYKFMVHCTFVIISQLLVFNYYFA